MKNDAASKTAKLSPSMLSVLTSVDRGQARMSSIATLRALEARGLIVANFDDPRGFKAYPEMTDAGRAALAAAK